METISMHIKNKNKLSATYGRVFFFVVLSERLMKGTQKFIFSNFLLLESCVFIQLSKISRKYREEERHVKRPHILQNKKSRKVVWAEKTEKLGEIFRSRNISVWVDTTVQSVCSVCGNCSFTTIETDNSSCPLY